MPTPNDPVLGFTVRARKGRWVEVLHRGRLVASLGGQERQAVDHPRNRR